MEQERLREFTRILQRCKTGKASLDRRVISAEQWWKLRNRAEEQKITHSAAGEDFHSESGWLHNVIVSKHADAMEAYPEPRILPRERDDAPTARLLSQVIPCILEQNRFEQVYSDVMWQKLKTGTGVYRVSWDPARQDGLGDIAIERVDLLSLFWEPGVSDLQKSRYLFHTHWESNEELEEKYPSLRGKLPAADFTPNRFRTDDGGEYEGRSLVVEVYYKRKGLLHYCRYVGDTVLFATEDEESTRDRGLYDHGRYPFVIDCLFPIEGSPCGYGFVDLCHNEQIAIDLMRTAFVKNAVIGATPRYFQRIDGSVNEEEFADLNRSLVHVSGNLGEDSLRQIGFAPMSGVYVDVLNSTIQELRETSGNTETSSGNIHSGVTAASAIAALQEASSKGSRDAARSSYRAFGEVTELCIELIRQFYTLPRSFRIVGEEGAEEFVSCSAHALRPVDQGSYAGISLGSRLPVFDVRVSAQKKSSYSRLSQNELALQLYGMGLFAPGSESAAVRCLELMDFEGREELMSRLSRNARQMEQLQQLQNYRALAEALTLRYRPEMAGALGLTVPLPAEEAAV